MDNQIIQQQTNAVAVPMPGYDRQSLHFVAAPGEALEKVGSGLNAIGDAIQQQKLDDARAWVSSAHPQAVLDAGTMFNNMADQTKPGYQDFVPDFMGMLEKYASQTIQNAPPGARRLMAERMDALRTDYAQKAVAFQSSLNISYRYNQFIDGVDKAAKVVAADPSQAAAMLSSLHSTLPDVGPNNTVKLYDYATKQINDGYARGIIQADPEAAYKAFSVGPQNLTVTTPQMSNAVTDDKSVPANAQIPTDGQETAPTDSSNAAITAQPPQPPQPAQSTFTPAKTGTPIDDMTLEERMHYAQLAHQQIEANIVRDHQAHTLQQEQSKQLQDQIMQGFLVQMTKGTLTPQTVLDNPYLDFQQKQHFINGLDAQAKRMDNTDPGTFLDIFNRIHADPSTPNAITSPDQLYPYMGHGLSFSDMSRLRGELDGKSQPEGDLLKQFKQMAQAQISTSSLIAKDPEGEANFYKWNAYFDHVFAEQRAAGKTTYQLLDPSSKDYLGNTIQTFVRTPQQQITDMATRMSSKPVVALPAAQQRKPGESVDDYLKRTGAK